jgi:hypothetical protein
MAQCLLACLDVGLRAQGQTVRIHHAEAVFLGEPPRHLVGQQLAQGIDGDVRADMVPVAEMRNDETEEPFATALLAGAEGGQAG